jgi:hypothetical protein
MPAAVHEICNISANPGLTPISSHPDGLAFNTGVQTVGIVFSEVTPLS